MGCSTALPNQMKISQVDIGMGIAWHISQNWPSDGQAISFSISGRGGGGTTPSL